MTSSNSSSQDETNDFSFSSDMTLEDIRANHRHFCNERNWGKYHTPRNILLAMVGEVGELSEIFQWKGEVKKGLPEFSIDEKKHVGEEISDIMIYLIDLAAQCHIDLPAAVYAKMQLNAKKHPVASSQSQPDAMNYSLYGNQRYTTGSQLTDFEREEADGSEK